MPPACEAFTVSRARGMGAHNGTVHPAWGETPTHMSAWGGAPPAQVPPPSHAPAWSGAPPAWSAALPSVPAASYGVPAFDVSAMGSFDAAVAPLFEAPLDIPPPSAPRLPAARRLPWSDGQGQTVYAYPYAPPNPWCPAPMRPMALPYHVYGPWWVPTWPAVPLMYEAPEAASHDVPAPIGTRPTTPAAERSLEASALPFAAFGAEAVWRASAELVGLRRTTTRSGARLSSGRTVSPDRTAELNAERLVDVPTPAPGPFPAESEVAQPTPPTPGMSSASSASAEPPTPSSASDDALASSPLGVPLDDRSADLYRLVRAMGSMHQRPFPSLDRCSEAHASSAPAPVRQSVKREHSALLGEVSPAFRHFVQQVLAQTLLSPTTLLLALHYIHMFAGMLRPADGESDVYAALTLIAQPPSTAPFKLLTLGLMMANKFVDDNTFLNKTWHEVTGVPLAELNRMESYFLCRTQFHLSVSDSAWRQHLQAIRGQVYAHEPVDESARADHAILVKTLDELLAAHVPGLCV